MPNFTYQAVDKSGKIFKGVIEASDMTEAAKAIKIEGKTPVSIVPAGIANRNVNITIFEKRPKARDLSVFCRQFVSISSAGVSIVSAFDMLSEQTENKLLAQAIGECCLAIRQGSSLSEAMAEHPKIFTELFVTMVAAGEASGNLELSFDRMAIQYEKDAKLRSVIRKASAYPSVVLCIAIIVIVGMLGFVVPNFEEILFDLNVEMPAFSLAVINAGRFVSDNLLIIFVAIFILVLSLRQASKTALGKEIFSTVNIKMPLFGRLVVKASSARMCRTLSTLVAAGIPLIQCIEIVSDIMTNQVFRKALVKASEDVSMGAPLSTTLKPNDPFPALVCHMIKIGEESGDFESMLTKLADYYDEDVEQTTSTVMAAIEPLLILVLAAIILVIIGAVMWPMTSIYDGLNAL